jgi:hypothetical protein
MLRSISWFYIRLAFDVDSGLYLKLKQADFSPDVDCAMLMDASGK